MSDALLVLSLIAIVLLAAAALSSAFGVDSRDGFVNDRLGPSLR